MTSTRLDVALASEEWFGRGACHPDEEGDVRLQANGRPITDLFYPPPGERRDDRERREASAMIYCRSCPVLPECRDYARAHREHGFWGGEGDKKREQAIRAQTIERIKR
jgi:WhiB family redox-sensing transcriptional regulator